MLNEPLEAKLLQRCGLFTGPDQFEVGKVVIECKNILNHVILGRFIEVALGNRRDQPPPG